MNKNVLMMLICTLFTQQKAFSHIAIRGLCLAPDGSIHDAHDANDGQSWYPGITFLDDTSKQLIYQIPDRNDWLVNSCDNETNHQLNMEFDPEVTVDQHSDSYGWTQARWDALNAYFKAKTNKGAYKFLSVYGCDSNLYPMRMKRDNDHYALFELHNDNNNTIITDQSLSDVCDLFINQNTGPHESRIAKNIDDLVQSKSSINKDLVTKQIHGLANLLGLYRQHAGEVAGIWGNHFKDLLYSKNANTLQDTSYGNLANQFQNLANFINSTTVGSNVDQGKLNEMKTLTNQLDALFSKLIIVKKSMPSVFQDMDKISNDMPGNTPNEVDKLNTSGKYRAQVRLVSQALGNDQDALKIFYNLDAMNAQLQSIKGNIKDDQSVTGNFIPDLDKRISDFLNEIDVTNKARATFESQLNQSAKQGKQPGTDSSVSQAVDALNTAIEHVEKHYNTIQTLIQQGSTIQDSRFKDILEGEKKRLDPNGGLKNTMDDLNTYKSKMTQKVADAYQKAQDAALKPITTITDEVNNTLKTLTATLQPISDKINNSQDATVEYTKAQASIQSMLGTLSANKDKLVKLEPQFQDPNQKAMITTAENTITTQIANVQQIESNTKIMGIAAHFKQAEAIRASTTAANGEFRIALLQYSKTKGPTDTIMKAYNKVLASVQETLGLLAIDLKNLQTMDQKNPSVAKWKTQGTLYVAPKTTPGSLQHIFYNYATLQLTNLGLQVASPTV